MQEVWSWIVEQIPLLIASLSAIAIAYNGWRQRQHDRKTLWPKLSPSMRFPRQGSDFDIRLENNGTGPAVIESVDLFVDGELVERNPLEWAVVS